RVAALYVCLSISCSPAHRALHSFPTRRSSDLDAAIRVDTTPAQQVLASNGTPLNLSFGGHYNLSARLPLSNMPLLLRQAFVMSEDRKSTRLNSSHVSISYAVFCLKKKNQSSLE